MITVKIEIAIPKKDLKNHDLLRGAVLIAFNNALREYRFSDSRIRTHIGFEDILNIVLEDFPNLTLDILKKPSREPFIVEVRYIIIYFCKLYTNYSYSYIGKKIGLNHSTAISGFESIEGFIDVYPIMKKRIELIDNKINDLINFIHSHPIHNECTNNNKQP